MNIVINSIAIYTSVNWIIKADTLNLEWSTNLIAMETFQKKVIYKYFRQQVSESLSSIDEIAFVNSLQIDMLLQ